MGMILGEEGYGQTSITKFMLGSEQVDKIYKGSIQVWPDSGSTDTGTVGATWSKGLDWNTGSEFISFPSNTPIPDYETSHKNVIVCHISGDGNRVGVVVRVHRNAGYGGRDSETWLSIFEKTSNSAWAYKASASLGYDDTNYPDGRPGAMGVYAGVHVQRSPIDCDATGTTWVVRLIGAYSLDQNGVGVFRYEQSSIGLVDILQADYWNTNAGNGDKGRGPGDVEIGHRPSITNDGSKIGFTILQADNTVAYKTWTNTSGSWQGYNNVITQGSFHLSTANGYNPSWQQAVLSKDGSVVYGLLAFTSNGSEHFNIDLVLSYASISRWVESAQGTWTNPTDGAQSFAWLNAGFMSMRVPPSRRHVTFSNEHMQLSCSDDGEFVYLSKSNYVRNNATARLEEETGKAWLFQHNPTSVLLDDQSSTFPGASISPTDTTTFNVYVRDRELNKGLSNGISSDGTRVMTGHTVPQNGANVSSNMYVFTSSNGQFNPLGNPLKFHNTSAAGYENGYGGHPFSLSRDGQTIAVAVDSNVNTTYSAAFQVYTTTD